MRAKHFAFTLPVILIAAGVILAQGKGKLAPSGPDEAELASKVAVIPLHGNIDYGLQKSLERRVEEALADGAKALLFEMDTYGGGLDPAHEIGDYINDIKKTTKGAVKTIAYVRKKAISAGALVSLACREIVMRSGTTIGDCQPIQIDPKTQTMQEAPEKIQSLVRALMRKYAQSNGYPVILCEAMVDPDIEVWQLRLKGDEEPRYLTSREIETLSTENREGLKKEPVVLAGKLLTMTDTEAHEYGFSRKSVDSRREAIDLYATPAAAVTTYDTNWSEELVRFLNSMGVASVLMIVGMISLYMAFKTPGFGAAEIVAIFCFATLFLSKYLVGLATTVEILVFVIGVVLLAIEFFVIPGFGVVGITGILCVLTSLVLALQKFNLPEYNWELADFIGNLFTVFGSLAVATVLFMVTVRFMPRTPFLKKLVLATSESAESGYVVGSAGRRDLIGKAGVVLSTLRPSGRAEIEGKAMIVVAQGEFIEAGTPVVVSDVRGNRVVVTKA